MVVGNLGQTHVAYASDDDDSSSAVVKLGTKMAPKQLLCVTPPHFLTPTHSARSLPRIHSPSLRSASVEKAVGSCDIQEGNEARNCVVKYILACLHLQSSKQHASNYAAHAPPACLETTICFGDGF